MTGLLHDQLPRALATDESIVAFVSLLDPIATSIYERVGSKEWLFDPALAPLGMVRWRASMIGVDIDPELPDTVQREVATVAAAMFPRRGTRRSIEANIVALTGGRADVVDGAAITVEPAARMAEQPPLGPKDRRDDGGTETPTAVIITVQPHRPVDERAIRATIEREIGGDVAYVLQGIDEHRPPTTVAGPNKEIEP